MMDFRDEIRESIYPYTKQLITALEIMKENLSEDELVSFEHLKANVAIFEELRRRKQA
jgi:hypothetical protein